MRIIINPGFSLTFTSPFQAGNLTIEPGATITVSADHDPFVITDAGVVDLGGPVWGPDDEPDAMGQTPEAS